MKRILSSLELEYTTLEFYSFFVVSRVREGAVLRKEQIDNLVEVCLEFYAGNPFAYISKRVNNYNVDPTIYYSLLKVHNLKGIAVVSDRVASLNMARFEKQFSKVPFEIFNDFPEAIAWAEKLVPQEN